MRQVSRLAGAAAHRQHSVQRGVAWKKAQVLVAGRGLSSLASGSPWAPSRTSHIIDLDDDLDKWPRSKANSIINVCAQGERMVVERLGKLNEIHESGWFFAIPFVDNIRFVIDMREKALSISPQSAITKDNVHVLVSGNLSCQFVDPEKAAYGSKNPIYAVKQHAQSSMRAAIGELELDQILRARTELNTVIRTSVQEAAGAWGLDIKRYEITEVTPDRTIQEAMGRQAASERERRSKVLEAEGNKKSAELESEGVKIRMKNESEGFAIEAENKARVRKLQLQLEAEGEAQQIEIKARAQAQAIALLSQSLRDAGDRGAEAARLAIARDLIDMYGEIGSKSNTMFFSERPADVTSLLAQAASVLNGSGPLAGAGAGAAKGLTVGGVALPGAGGEGR